MSLKLKNCFYNWINVTNIYGVIRPFYYVAKFYGFAPFQLNDRHRPSPEGGVISVTDCIIIVFSFCNYLYVLNTFFKLEVEMETLNEHTFVTTSRSIVCIICTSMSIVCIMTNILCRHHLMQIANDFRRIDNELTNSGYNIPHKKHFIITISGITLKFCCTTVNAYFLSLLVATCRVDYLNQLIRDLPDNSNQPNMVRTMALIHDKLCDVVDVLNKCMSLQVMVLMSCNQLFNVFTIFDLYTKINANSSSEYLKVTDFVLTISWGIVDSIPPFAVICVGALLKQKGRETGIMIHKTIFLISDKMALKETQAYNQELIVD